MKYTTFAYEMLRTTKRCVTFNALNFHNGMESAVTLSNTQPHCVVLSLLHETHQPCIYIQTIEEIVVPQQK